MRPAVRYVLLTLLAFASGCTAVGEIRTTYESTQRMDLQTDIDLMSWCSRGQGHSSAGTELSNSIEDYGSHIIGYVEFSDQGWEYNSGKQRRILLQRMRDDLAKNARPDTIHINIVFVHGWHHSARGDDCNVNEFRAMIHRVHHDLNLAAKNSGTDINYRVNGIYAGWRGESLEIPFLRQLTIIERQATSERVAKGAIRELFADLRNLQFTDEGFKIGDQSSSRIRTIIVGHSLGALIAFHSLSPALINDLSLSKPLGVWNSSEAYICGKAAAARSFWPDFTILINPAFEASRFEAVHNVASESIRCKDERPRPKLVVVTSDNDAATGTFFPLLRAVGTVFEKYDNTSQTAETMEREANLHAVGFVQRYQTHRLDLESVGDKYCVRTMPLQPAGNANAKNPADHVWVVGVPKEIVFGHDGFLYPDPKTGHYEPYLLNWLVSVYLDGTPRRPPFQGVANAYRAHRCVAKTS